MRLLDHVLDHVRNEVIDYHKTFIGNFYKKTVKKKVKIQSSLFYISSLKVHLVACQSVVSMTLILLVFMMGTILSNILRIIFIAGNNILL